MPVQCNVTVKELRRGYNSGKATGRTNFAPNFGPSYNGTRINFVFCKNMVVEYHDMSGKLVAKFQDNAALDD